MNFPTNNNSNTSTSTNNSTNSNNNNIYDVSVNYLVMLYVLQLWSIRNNRTQIEDWIVEKVQNVIRCSNDGVLIGRASAQ